MFFRHLVVVRLAGQVGIEPTLGELLTTIAFATLSVCGLDYSIIFGFTLRWTDYSLCTFKSISTFAWLKIATFKVQTEGSLILQSFHFDISIKRC